MNVQLAQVVHVTDLDEGTLGEWEQAISAELSRRGNYTYAVTERTAMSTPLPELHRILTVVSNEIIRRASGGFVEKRLRAGGGL